MNKLQYDGYICGCYDNDSIPGLSFHRNIVQLLSASKKIVVVLSKAFIERPVCNYELDVAVSLCIRTDRTCSLIPVVLDDCEIPESLEILSRLDASSSINICWPKFLRAIEDEEMECQFPQQTTKTSNAA